MQQNSNNNNLHLKRSHFIKDITDKELNSFVRVAGWIEDFRDIGKLGFITLRDITGSIQCVLNGENLKKTRSVPRQSSIMISGIIKQSKSKNSKFEIKSDEIYIFSVASLTLPIDPTGRVESNLDNRLDSRSLDLRNPNISKIFLLRSNILKIVRDYFIQNNFIEVNTPKIIGSASEGGSNLFSFDYFKSKAYLAQSPQLYKEQLVLSMDRVFEIAPYFRAENSHTLRHLNEFMSIDIEAAYIDYFDVMDIVEKLIKKLLSFISEISNNDSSFFNKNTIDNIISKSFPQISYEKCLEILNGLGENLKFGDDLSDAALKKLGQEYDNFYFIIDWPLNLKPFYIHENTKNPLLSQSFDLQFGYLELVSGGTRQHDINKLKQRLESQGLSVESFKDHLRSFEWGMPPHSGCGLGFDRLMMVLANIQNIREVVLYPRDTGRISP